MEYAVYQACTNGANGKVDWLLDDTLYGLGASSLIRVMVYMHLLADYQINRRYLLCQCDPNMDTQHEHPGLA